MAGLEHPAVFHRQPGEGGAPADPDPSGDATIHILTSATGFDVGVYSTMLYTRDNQGKWSFANVALPAGTTIEDWTSINSSGVIAAIGNGALQWSRVPKNPVINVELQRFALPL